MEVAATPAPASSLARFFRASTDAWRPGGTANDFGLRPMLFGVLLPALVLTLDNQWNSALGFRILPYRPASPLFAFACIGVLAAWWAFRRRWPILDAVAAGPLFAGAAFAGAIGLLLFPFALLFSIVLVGLPGLVPLGTALVFAGACGDAASAAVRRLGAARFAATAALSLLAFLGLCAGASAAAAELEARQSAVVAGTRPGHVPMAKGFLRALYWFPGSDMETLRTVPWTPVPHREDMDPRRLYERITGRPVNPADWDD